MGGTPKNRGVSPKKWMVYFTENPIKMDGFIMENPIKIIKMEPPF